MGSEPCGEPDASTSEPLHLKRKNVANVLSSPSHDPNISADEDEETSPLDHETATLSSELFARLGRRILPKNNVLSNFEPANELGTENDNGSDRTQTNNGSVPLSEAGRNQEFNLEDGSLWLFSNLLQKDLPADEPFLLGNDGRIEINGSWDKQSSYFQSRKSIVNHLNQLLPADVQSLEKALLILSQEVNKLEGMRKALSIFSQSIEADPKSEILWISYLLIYYGSIKSIANEDMFSHVVKHNDRSYGLRLMYINSHMHLDDRLAAYVAALTALCRQSFACERVEMNASTCFLDLFL
ncbi:uncharacterized protein LOC110638363 [Hevea brasiliensis]|uniref:uncharacterized protein LOC110638363 n=1 Tax=Hevea brasiliensis TaxID=3981 RepID=UPI0025EDF6B9|nr:uncharacterized protein LOC110638363 [Hevea brasiliensis]